MSPPADPSIANGADPRALEALLSFWVEVGVEVSASAAPMDRLKAPPPRAASPQAAAPPARPAQNAPPVPSAPPRGSAPATNEAAVAAARDLARPASTLAEIEQALQAFEGCALRHSGAVRPIFVRGDPATADILVIGEAPGADDEAAGSPFQGAQGRLIDRMLQAAGLSERALLINTVFWRTPGGGAPSANDQAACRPFLERAALLLKPRAVLLLGAAAARATLRTEDPILKVRGRWAHWTGEHEAFDLPALPTFSPAFLLAQPRARKNAWADLLTLAARVDPGAGAP